MAADAFARAYAAVADDATLQTRFADAPLTAPAAAIAGDGGALGRSLAGTHGTWVIAFVLLGAILLFLLYHLVTGPLAPGLRRAGRPRRRVDAGAAAGVTAAAADHGALARGEALAAQGRFTEAVHEILRASVTGLAARFPALLRPAVTSRAIARDPALPAPLREAFGGIAREVERGVFAGQALGLQEYTACRALYDRLAPTDPTSL